MTTPRKHYPKSEASKARARELAKAKYYADHTQSLAKAKAERVKLKSQAKFKSEHEVRQLIAQRLLYHAKWRAKRDGLEFNLEIEDICIPDVCPLLEVPLTLSYYASTDKGPKLHGPSLDRIDNNIGYIKGNVWVISHQANTMKGCATLQELQTFVANLTKAFNSFPTC